MTSREALALAVVATPALAAVATAVAPRRMVRGVAVAGAVAAAAAAATLSAISLASPGSPLVEKWLVVDAAAGLLIGVIGAVGLTGVLVSPAYLAAPSTTGLVRPERRPRIFYALLLAFWAILAAVPLVGNLGGAWLLVEATTAASALLVGFGGKPRALEAAWKYLILTSLGLGVALLGIVILAAGRRTAASTRFPGASSRTSTLGTAQHSSPTCCCSRGWPRKSAGPQCTTGCRMPTRRRPRRSPLCCRPRSCRQCCSSPGAPARR